jgi:hypothetical protein
MDIPSNGFMRASLAIVAHAPLSARKYQHANQNPKTKPKLTSSNRVVAVVDIATGQLLDSFICAEIDSVCRAYASV